MQFPGAPVRPSTRPTIPMPGPPGAKPRAKVVINFPPASATPAAAPVPPVFHAKPGPGPAIPLVVLDETTDEEISDDDLLQCKLYTHLPAVCYINLQAAYLRLPCMKHTCSLASALARQKVFHLVLGGWVQGPGFGV